MVAGQGTGAYRMAGSNGGGATGGGLDWGAFLAAIDAAPAAIVITDPRLAGNPVRFVNAEFTAITGYSAAEVLGRSLSVLQGPKTDPAAVANLRAAVAEGRAATVELVNYRKDGEEFWMRVSLRPVRDADDALCAFVGILADISEIRRSEANVRETEERLRALVEAVPLPMLTVGMDGTILRANAAAHQALGVPPGDLAGRPTQDFHFAGDEGADRLCAALRGMGEPQRVELRVLRADGLPLWVLASVRRFTVQGGTRSLLTFQDVTDLKRKEEALTQANEEAERSIRARMRFLAAASHDLRQPLQALALFTSALDNHISTPQGRTIVQSMKTSLRGMEEMFDALMDMSKLDAGVMKAEPQLFLVNDVFERLEANYGPQAAAAGLELTVLPSSLAVRSDPRLLSRILGNFLSNAIRYTRQGRILLGAKLKGGAAVLRVCDTGPGIPDDQRLAIFREFHQVSQPSLSGRGTGMGLGLAIVQRLARLLDHRVEVHSVLGHGSCFGVTVPLVEDWFPLPDGAAAESDEVREVQGATVVVLDDDPDILDGLEILLANWGCRPVVAESAAAALAALAGRRLRPDAVIADLHLHAANAGIDAINAIRAAEGRAVPAFLFTGDTEATGGASHVSGFSVLRKPLDPARLRSLLPDALGR